MTHVLAPGTRLTVNSSIKEIDKAGKSVVKNNSVHTSFNNLDLVEFNDNYDITPLTSDMYTLDAEEEAHILQEFPVLQASSAPVKKPVLKQQQRPKRPKKTRQGY